jgi:hypothetical protein
LNPIGNDRFTISRASQNNPTLKLVAGYRFGDWPDECRVIYWLLGVGAKINYGMTQALDKVTDFLFVLIPRMIGTYRKFHGNVSVKVTRNFSTRQSGSFSIASLVISSQFGQIAEQITEFRLGKQIRQARGHHGPALFLFGNLIARDSNFSLLQNIAQDNFLGTFSLQIALIILAIFRRYGDGHITFFDFPLRFQNCSNDEIDRVSGTHSAKIRSNRSTLTIDGVAGNAAELRPMKDFCPLARVARTTDVLSKYLHLFGFQHGLLNLKTGSGFECVHQSLALTARGIEQGEGCPSSISIRTL